MFAYWLIEALKGHADRDRQLSWEELFEYVRRQVSMTADQQFSTAQQTWQFRDQKTSIFRCTRGSE